MREGLLDVSLMVVTFKVGSGGLAFGIAIGCKSFVRDCRSLSGFL